MYNKKRLRLILIAAVFALGAVLLALFPVLLAPESVPAEIRGPYTLAREMEIGGRTVEFFESGDGYFKYYHDKDGYVLIRTDNNLYYAVNDNGRPVASDISVTASASLIKSLPKMSGWDVDLSANSDLLTSYETPDAPVIEKEPLYAAASSERQIVNIVIYIAFSNDTHDTRMTLQGNPADRYLSAPGNSLGDYFYTMSSGELIVSSITPREPDTPSLTYVYQDTNNRSYYNINTPVSERGKREAILLTSAVNAAKNKFSDLPSYNLDINGDGYIDALTFVVSGSKSSDWGSLLWPHKWNLTSINNSYNNNTVAEIGGKKVGDYSFNFVGELDVGTMCHEFHHILGAPDLYHYDRTDDYPNRDRYGYAPVGKWDLMQTQTTVPQYSLTYMRNKYTGGIGENRIITLAENGIYSLRPVSLSEAEDVLAYRTPSVTVGNGSEYFMMEYRNPNAALTYDSMLPGSGGLIIYRVREDNSLDGNVDALYKDAAKPDEVLVFRPIIQSESATGTRKENSRYNLEYAALSPDNQYFSSVGIASTSTKYLDGALYYSNGNNSGYVISALSISRTAIQFKVRLNGDNNIDENYFVNRLFIDSAAMVNGSYSGVSVKLRAGDLTLAYLEDIKITLKNAGGTVLSENVLNLEKFREAYEGGERIFDSPFVVSEKGSLAVSVFKRGSFNFDYVPQSAEISVTDAAGRTKLIVQRTIDSAGLSWNAIKNTREEPFRASIAAASGLTVGINNKGEIFASGVNQSDFFGLADITAVSSGAEHTLLLGRDKKVIFAGESYYGEDAVGGWENIRAVAAGYYASYGITIYDEVVAAGLNNKGQLDILGWRNVKEISAGDGFVVGLTYEGLVISAGDTSGGRADFTGWTNIISITAGNNFTAGLNSDGTVVVAGNLYGKENVKLWTDVVKISAGVNILYALRADGTVLSTGDNGAGQCETDGLIDIIDIAAGEYHGAFLRADGVVEYAGAGSYHIDNLIYDSYTAASGVVMTLPHTEIYAGLTMMAATVVSPLDATYKRIVYSSSDPSVAEVNIYGKITAVGAGTAVITARVNGTDIINAKTVTVRENIPPEAISFADTVKSVKKGQTSALILIETPAGAAMIYENITFISSNPEAVSVSDTGEVTGHAVGISTITARYDYNGNILEATCTVKVVLDISSIRVVRNPKTDYLFGEPFDVSGGRLKVTFPDGNEEEISITSDMVVGFNPSLVGGQSVTITYMDKEAVITINVSDYIVSAEIIAYPKTEYLYGEDLSVQGGVIKLNRAAGGFTNRAMKAADITNFSSTRVGEYALSVSFVEGDVNFRLTYNIRVNDTVDRIESRLVKKTYNFMEDLVATERIALIMKTGVERTVFLSEMPNEGYRKNEIGHHTVTFSYTDTLTGITHYASENIEVTIEGGEFAFSGADEDGIYWYELGWDGLPFELTFSIGGKAIEVGLDYSAGIWMVTSGFDPNRLGTGQISVAVYIKSNMDGEGYRVVYEPPALRTQGIARVIGEPEFTGVKEYYVYGERPSIGLKVTLEGGTVQNYTPEASAVSYDPELVEAWQDYKIKYTNKWFSVPIYIKDKALRLVPIPDTTVLFGSTPEISVYADMAKGADRKLTAGVTFTNLNTSALGTRTVTVSYSGELGAFMTTFKLTVADAPANIAEKTRIKLTYKYGEPFDTSSQYTVTMLSGLVKDVNYNADEFKYSPAYNPNKTGNQTITIEYIPTGKKFSYSITTVNYITHLEIDSLSKSKYTYGENIELTVRAVYADGAKTNLNAKDYTTNFDSTKLGQQIVTVTHNTKDGTAVTGNYTVTIDDKVTKLEISGSATIKEYRYGEPPRFLGLTVTITYASSKVETARDNEIGRMPAVTVTFNPLTAGAQNVVLTAGGQSASFRVTVLPASEATLFSVTGEKIKTDREKRTVTLYEPLTYGELFGRIKTADYLTLRMRNGAGTVYDMEVSGEDILLSGVYIDILNSAGLVVRTYRAYLRGDANGDGRFDASDIDGIARQYLEGMSASPVNDYDGDAQFTLTDLVKWIKESRVPPEPPLNSMARTFVSDYKPKKEEKDG